MLGKLTIAGIEGAAPAAKPYEIRYSELPGLILRVQPSGRRTFYVELARGVRERVGAYPVTTIKTARSQAMAKLAAFAKTGERSKPTAKAETFGSFLEDRYGPWVKAERKAGAATLANLKSQFGEYLTKPMSAITAWNMERFKADRLRAGIKPATVNRDLVRIRACLSKAVEWGLLADHPLRSVKRAKGADDSRTRFLSEPEEKRLRSALEALKLRRREHLVPMVALALNTGLRRGELFGLTWGDVSLVRALLTVTAASAKGQVARHIPLNREAIAALQAWEPKKTKPTDLVFPGNAGARMTNVNKSWAHLAEQAKLSDFRFHDLRHHFASRLVMAGVDLNTVRELLGHSDLKMTLRYAHLAPAHKAAAVETLVREA